MYVQARVRMLELVCVCQVVINKDRNIGSPAGLTCLQGTCHQCKHTEDKLLPTNCTGAKTFSAS